MSSPLDHDTRTEVEASVMRKLIKHLDEHKEVQNIDLMILADFCRNCLSKWYVAGATEQGVDLSLEQAHQAIYGMSYADWKSNHQTEATQAQLDALTARKSQ